MLPAHSGLCLPLAAVPVASYKSTFLHFQRDLILSPAPICWRFHKASLSWPELVSQQGNCLLRNVCLQELKRTGVAGTRVLRPCFNHSSSGECSLMRVAGGSTQNYETCCLVATNLFVADWPFPQPVTHWKTWSPVRPKGLSWGEAFLKWENGLFPPLGTWVLDCCVVTHFHSLPCTWAGFPRVSIRCSGLFPPSLLCSSSSLATSWCQKLNSSVHWCWIKSWTEFWRKQKRVALLFCQAKGATVG